MGDATADVSIPLVATSVNVLWDFNTMKKIKFAEVFVKLLCWRKCSMFCYALFYCHVSFYQNPLFSASNLLVVKRCKFAGKLRQEMRFFVMNVLLRHSRKQNRAANFVSTL